MSPVETEDCGNPSGPPADPEEWTDEEWIEWLTATDPEEPEAERPPVTTGGRIVHSSAGMVLGEAMLAVGRVIFGRHDDEIVIVAEGKSEPEEDQPFTVHLDPEHPERSTAVFKGERPEG